MGIEIHRRRRLLLLPSSSIPATSPFRRPPAPPSKRRRQLLPYSPRGSSSWCPCKLRARRLWPRLSTTSTCVSPTMSTSGSRTSSSSRPSSAHPCSSPRPPVRRSRWWLGLGGGSTVAHEVAGPAKGGGMTAAQEVAGYGPSGGTTATLQLERAAGMVRCLEKVDGHSPSPFSSSSTAMVLESSKCAL